jgi:hypothetical protein
MDYINNRNFSEDPCNTRDEDGDCETGPGFTNLAALDNGPEGLAFVPAKQSPNGKPLLIVGNEISGSTTIYQVNVGPEKDHGHGYGRDDDEPWQGKRHW